MTQPSGESALYKLLKTIEPHKMDDSEREQDPTPLDNLSSAEISARLRNAGIDLEKLERQRLERRRKIDAHGKHRAPGEGPTAKE